MMVDSRPFRFFELCYYRYCYS